jgi:hypothetical protein
MEKAPTSTFKYEELTFRTSFVCDKEQASIQMNLAVKMSTSCDVKDKTLSNGRRWAVLSATGRLMINEDHSIQTQNEKNMLDHINWWYVFSSFWLWLVLEPTNFFGRTYRTLYLVAATDNEWTTSSEARSNERSLELLER